MKPRRWYSSPELDPSPGPRRARLPEAVYWTFTTRTRYEQGSVIKAVAPEADAAQQRRAALRSPRAIPLIDAA